MKPEFKINSILRPSGWLYGLITGIRNRLYDRKILSSASFPIPIISVGNITVGGTGKTPHAEYLVQLLAGQYRTAVLSRGYGRHTRGFNMSDDRSDSGLIGDEPLQIKRRFPNVEVAVCNNRAEGIRRLMEMCSPQVIILDDAFQHRSVTPSLNILLVNWHRNILDDAMLPAGRLRESAKGRSRADIIIVTKCPENLTAVEMDSLAERLRTRGEQQVFFSAIEYGAPYLMDEPGNPLRLPTVPLLAVTGIASPELMAERLRGEGYDITRMDYPDHHQYNKQDLADITSRLESLGPDAAIVTTAKDAARLTDMNLNDELRRRIYVLPVGIRLIRDAERFTETVTGHIDSILNNK